MEVSTLATAAVVLILIIVAAAMYATVCYLKRLVDGSGKCQTMVGHRAWAAARAHSRGVASP